ncbi:MAG: response regulator [Pseudomonadota bacterium]
MLLVDDDAERAAELQLALLEMGYDTQTVVDNAVRVLKVMSDLAPDVVIVDMAAPGRDILESLSILAIHQPTPVVMFSGQDDPAYINKAVDAGVSAYLVGEIDVEQVKPAIEVAIAQFRLFQNLRTQLQETQAELDDAHAIDQAKRLLIRSAGIDEAEAYARLRAQAMSCGASIADVAKRMLDQTRER